MLTILPESICEIDRGTHQLPAQKVAVRMKKATPSRDSHPCLFSVFHGLVAKLHETDRAFLSETLEKPEKRCFKTVTDWFDATTSDVQAIMEDFLRDARFEWLEPESPDVFFRKLRETCLSISFTDKQPSPLSTLGRFLFWSCLDKSCHESIADGFERLKNAKWATSARLKWSLLCCSQYSIEIATTTIFRHIQSEMELASQQSAQEVVMTKLLVRLLMAKDIVPRSAQFYSQIGPSCRRFSGLKISDQVKTGNMFLAVTDSYSRHIRDKTPRPHEAALATVNAICRGETRTGTMRTGVDIGTYAQDIGFKHTSGRQISKENQELECTSETGSRPAKRVPQICSTLESTQTKKISGKQVKEAPSAADQQKKKKMSVSTPSGLPDQQKKKKMSVNTRLPPRVGYLIGNLTKSVPDDFRLTVSAPLPEDLGLVEDADGLRLLIAFLMIVKNSGDSTGGRVLALVLKEELNGVSVNSVATVLKHLRQTSSRLFKSEFIQRLFNSDLKQLSGSDVWREFFETECDQVEGKGKDTASRATAESRRSLQRGQARTTATTKTDAKNSEKEKPVQRKEGGTHGNTTGKRKSLQTKQNKQNRKKSREAS